MHNYSRFQCDINRQHKSLSLSLNYSQTWELRPPKGLGVSGPIFQVVSFARFGSKNFNVELYTCPCASHYISDRWFPRVSGGVIGNGLAKRSLQTRWSLVRSACEGKVRQSKKCFSLNFTYVVAFCRLDRRFGPTFGVRNSHFSGGRIFKNALRKFESVNSWDWNCVSAIFRWSLLSGGRTDRLDCTNDYSQSSLAHNTPSAFVPGILIDRPCVKSICISRL